MEERLKLLKESKIPHASIHVNPECVACHETKREMVKLGSIFFCPNCFLERFFTNDPVDLERDQYLKFVKDSEIKV